MSIARDRARVMAANDVMSHTEPDGTSFVDRINAAHITWYAAGEIIAWNHYPAQYSTAEAISAWWASPGHHAIMASTGYNYVGFGAAMSATGKFYYAGVFAKTPDHTVPWARMGSVSMSTVDAHHKRVTVRWSGGDTRLQVLTSGLRYFQVQWRAVGGLWHAWTTSTATHKSITMVRGVSYEVRLRSRDHAGNWGALADRQPPTLTALAPATSPVGAPRQPSIADIVRVVRIVRRPRTFQLHRTDDPGRARSKPSSRDTTH